MKVNLRVSAMVFYKGKLVLVRHYKEGYGDYYLLPGGGLEHSESLEECVVREVKEECGLDVKVDRLAFYKQVYTDSDDTLDIIFSCKVIGGKLENIDPDKKVNEIKLISSEKEFGGLNFHPKQLKRFLFRKNKGVKSLGKAKYPE